VASHFDPYFSMWRLSWVAHALRNEPANLFEGNVFHPAGRTLAMSDATLLQGLLAAPLLWAGVSPALAYNLLLLGGIAGSGLAMFILARSLTGTTGSALAAATVFTMGPYRIEHFMHLELQWAMWIPLALWAVHHALSGGSRTFGLLAGVFLWLQFLSSVYYGMFLSIVLTVFVPLAAFAAPRDRAIRGIAWLLAGAGLAVLLTLPYAIPYLQNAQTLGDRPLDEMLTYSARRISYLSSPEQNWLWGWTESWGAPELHLFPGLTAVLLAVLAVLHRPRTLVLPYFVVAIVAIELSFGPTGRIYSWLLDHVSPLHGLRAPSRLAIVVLCATAMLAGFGMRAIQLRLARQRTGAATAVVAVVFVLMLAEYRNTGMSLATVAPDPPAVRNVYVTVRSLGPGAVFELPRPDLRSLPGYDPWYAFWSRTHWHPLLNGYSGYYPPEYPRTIANTEHFPDSQSIEYLRELDVRYVIVHRGHFEDDDDFVSLILRMTEEPALERFGSLEAPHGEAELFLLTEQQ
jgi:hypothetical protein